MAEKFGSTYMEYSEMRRKEQETQKQLRKIKAELLKQPQNDSTRAKLDQIDKALSITVPCLGTPESLDEQHAGSSNPAGQRAGASDPAGLLAGASVHIEGITDMAGVTLDYNVSALKIRPLVEQAEGVDAVECATRHDELLAWKTRERKKAAMYSDVREGLVQEVLDDLKHENINDSGCSIETVRLLAQNEDAIFATDKFGRTLLHWTCQHGHVGEVPLLINKGWIMNATDSAGQTPLHLACMEGHLPVVASLILHGVDINMVDKSKGTALQIAVEKEHISIAEKLISIGANLAMTDGHMSVLHIACQKGFTDLVRKLIEAGADIAVPGVDRLTPVHLAIREGHNDMIKELSKKQGQYSGINYQTLQSMIVDGGRMAEAEGSDPCMNFVYFSIINNNDEIAKFFIEEGVDTNVLIEGGYSMLHIAVARDCILTIKSLFQKGIEVDATDKHGRTPLYCACSNGDLSVIKALVKKGADVNKTDNKNRSPLFAACRGVDTKEQVVKYLLQQGADIDKQDTDGRTVLHQACLKGASAVVSILLKDSHVADIIGALDNNGQTALSLAEEKCNSAEDTASKKTYKKIISSLRKCSGP